MAPEVLVLQLKRFNYVKGRPVKNTKLITFDEILQVGPELINTNIALVKYELVAVLNHLGISPGAGHYHCYIKNTLNNTWLYCDDTSVIEIDTTKIVTRNAYVLIYRKA
jgi:ubiquitin C-terminal hydrolase